MKQCKRCNKINTAEIHTCTPGLRNKEGKIKKESKSKVLRNVLFKVYEGLSLEYRNKVPFQEFYEKEMTTMINIYKNQI